MLPPPPSTDRLKSWEFSVCQRNQTLQSMALILLPPSSQHPTPPSNNNSKKRYSQWFVLYFVMRAIIKESQKNEPLPLSPFPKHPAPEDLDSFDTQFTYTSLFCSSPNPALATATTSTSRMALSWPFLRIFHDALSCRMPGAHAFDSRLPVRRRIRAACACAVLVAPCE